MRDAITQLRPGLPGYTGLKSGIFAVIHHDRLLEYSHDVFERLDYIDKYKSENERKTRRESILYLGECPALAEYDEALAKCNKAADEFKKAKVESDKAATEYNKAAAKREKGWAKRHRARAKYAKAVAEFKKAQVEYNKTWDELKKARDAVDQSAVLAYIHQHILYFPWDGRQLVFPKAASSAGIDV